MKRYGGAITNRRIIQIRRRDHLSRSDLAELTGYSEGYVTAWLLPVTSKYWKRAPFNAVRLLEFETGRRKPDPSREDNHFNDWPNTKTPGAKHG